jgi:hypothetical protein
MASAQPVEPPVRPPPGRYGPEPDPRARRRRVALLWVLGVSAVLVAGWFGLSAGTAPVTWQDVGFVVDGSKGVEVVFDVSRDDPSVAATCRLQALNQQYAQVGVREVDIPPSPDRTVRLRSTVETSERAVTGLVDDCWRP